MASHASWQTGGAGRVGAAGWGEAFPDQQAIENRLRRLMQQVEESERRYCEALDELQARLNQLAHGSDNPRNSGAGGDAATLDRLQDRVSGLARRFEHEASTSLDDFERLGRAVMGGLDREPSGFASGPSATPFPSPFVAERPTPASTPFTSPSPFAPEPLNIASPSFTFSAPGPGPSFPPFPPLPDVDRDLSKRLVEMAHRLENSVEEAMTPKAIDILNARIDAIGRQIADALRLATKPPSLTPLERQIADIARQLGQAEPELAKIGEIETALHRLIERMDGHAGQLSEVAAKAATEAAHLVSGEAKLDAATVARLDTMHRDLKAMGAHANAADDRLAGIIEAVHDALKQLARQVERSASLATAPRPDAPATEGSGAEQDQPPQGDRANGSGSTTEGSKGSPSRAPFGRAKRGQPDANAADLVEGNPVDLDAPPADPSLPKRTGRTQSEMEEDLVAAARRAAQAAALRAAERTRPDKRKWTPSGASFHADSRQAEARRVETHRADAQRVETPLRRGRPLLMFCAAVLLALSAVLLYGRLRTKSEPEPLPPAAEETAPHPSGSSQNGPLPGAAEKAPAGDLKNEAPPAPNSSSAAPDATSNPAGNRESGADENFTNVAKSSHRPAAVVNEPGQSEPAAVLEIAPQAEPAALQSIDEPALPPGVVFAVEDPAAGY
jgi:localization factor PodJL